MSVELMLFGMKRDLRQMAAKLAADFFSPAGPIPVERLVARHIDTFEKMRASGLIKKKLEIDPVDKEGVELIFRLYADGDRATGTLLFGITQCAPGSTKGAT